MIVIFHFLMCYVLKTIKKKLWRKSHNVDLFNITSINDGHHPLCEFTAENNIKFDPPMYKQRYERALEILTNDKWNNHIKKLVDFGCSKFNFFVFLKNNTQFSQLKFVDVDELLLKDCLYRVQPLNIDYINRRQNHLRVTVYSGSIADPDPCLLDADAIVGLEIVEHLYPDVLDALPYNLFGFIQPKLAIFTTPNADFNVLLKNVNKFRHIDHKFEWTREQFQSWALNIIERFPSYVVRFDGIGYGPVGFEAIGCCSQLAVFIRKDICDNVNNESVKRTCDFSKSYGICTYNSLSNLSSFSDDQLNYYTLITDINYPIHVDSRSDEEKNIDELKYYLNTYVDEFYNDEKHCSEVPLRILCRGKIKSTMSQIDVRNLLIKLNYQIDECKNQRTNTIEDCVIILSDMADHGSSDNESDASGYESDPNKCAVENDHCLGWDESFANEWFCETDANNHSTLRTEELHLDVNITAKQQAALQDSGYQKSPQALEDFLQDEALPIAQKPNKLSHYLSMFNNTDRINEVDSLGRDKRFFHFSNLPHKEMMKRVCKEIAKNPKAGPSHESKLRKFKKSSSSDSDESSEEVKLVTNCILENSLNRIDIDDEPRYCDIVQDIIRVDVAADEPVIVPDAPLVVENGDLANNNRDREGNNYVPLEVLNDGVDIDNVIIDNNNDVDLLDQAEADALDDENIPEEIVIEPLIDLGVDWSSREALFDVNSQVDLLEDYEMGGPSCSESNLDESCVENPESCNLCPVTLPINEENFPDWLLNLSDANGGPLQINTELHPEPHYYCQGDGLGVHVSQVDLNGEESDESNGTDSSQNSSSSGSADFELAEADTTLPQDSLLFESQVMEAQVVVNVRSEVEVLENVES